MTKYSEKEIERILALRAKATGPDLYVLAALAGEIFTACDQLAAAREIIGKLREALIEISRGAGRFDTDPHQHARNVIEDAIETAKEVLRLTEEST